MHVCFKAVSVHDGKYFSLGMGPAQSIALPVNRWMRDPKPYGISTAKSMSGARQVIKFARKRKRLPVPKNMTVVKVLGKDPVFENEWRAVFRRIKLITAKEEGESE